LVPQLLSQVDFSLRVCACLFLILRFNPLRTSRCNESDGQTVFSVALFLLCTSFATNTAIYNIQVMNQLYDNYF